MRSPTGRLLLLASLFAVVAASCSSSPTQPPVSDPSSPGSTSGSTSNSSSGGGGDSGACKVYSPCEMLTAADVTAAIGAAVGAGAMKDSSQPLLETTQCNWPSATTPASRTAGFLIECSDRPDLHPVVTKESSQQFYRNVVAVSGFGDAAFWGWDWYVDKTVPPGSGALSILIGTNIQLIVGAEGMPDEATCRAASEQLARKALAKL